MILKRFFSFIALAFLAFVFFFSATTNVRAGEMPTVKTKSAAVKYPPNVSNSFSAIRVVFVIERYSSYPSLLQRNLIPIILPPMSFELECYPALSPPETALFRAKDESQNLIEVLDHDNRARRPQPEFIRRGNRNK